MHWFPILGSLKNLTTGRATKGALAPLLGKGGDAREQCGSNKGWGGCGEAWGGGPWRAGKGGRSALLPPFQLPLGGEGGGWGEAWGGGPWGADGARAPPPREGGEAWGGGPWRAGKGGDGAGAESSVGATKKCTVPLVWLVNGGRARGEMGRGGGTREQCGRKSALVSIFDLLKT